jgi:hypothetical protein
MHPTPNRRSETKPWVPDPRLPHAFQAAPAIYYGSVHHQIFTPACQLCGHGRGARIHMAAEENDSPRRPQ